MILELGRAMHNFPPKLTSQLGITDTSCRYGYWDTVTLRAAKNTDTSVHRVFLKYNLNTIKILNK
jgi:hypothetical protein